jgi:hypothetical protein
VLGTLSLEGYRSGGEGILRYLNEARLGMLRVLCLRGHGGGERG